MRNDRGGISKLLGNVSDVSAWIFQLQSTIRKQGFNNVIVGIFEKDVNKIGRPILCFVLFCFVLFFLVGGLFKSRHPRSI